RKKWAEDFVRECRSRNLKLVSLTDHHDMGFVHYVVEAAHADGFTLVLPGVEITCSDNAQCLAFFDPTTAKGTWNHLLGKLKGIQQADENDPKTVQTEIAQITIKDLFEDVATDRALRDHCVVLPHFSDGNAHKSLNEDGHHERFASL